MLIVASRPFTGWVAERVGLRAYKGLEAWKNFREVSLRRLTVKQRWVGSAVS